MSGFLICYLCELAGRPAGQRFKVPAGDLGQRRMERHVLEPHPAARMPAGSADSAETIDLALDGAS